MFVYAWLRLPHGGAGLQALQALPGKNHHHPFGWGGEVRAKERSKIFVEVLMDFMLVWLGLVTVDDGGRTKFEIG